MVCIQCYLPPILFMLYMKFINPIVAPYIQPAINRLITYFRGPQAVSQSESCPIRRPASSTKKAETTAGGDSTSTKPKDD